MAVRDDGHFTTRSRLATVGVPSAALRILPTSAGWFAIDLGLYSAFLTQSLSVVNPSATKVSCSQNGGQYEQKLPCEANSVVYPYVAVYAGLMVGKSGVGFLTLAPVTIGLAQVGSDSNLRLYGGLTVGVLQVSGRF